jgi:hypothetical protein
VRNRAWTSRRKVAVFVLAGLGVAALGGSVRSGNAATSTKYYSTTLAPLSVGAGATAGETLTLKNSATSSQTLGSENVTVPSGYSATAGDATASAGKDWTATVSSGVIQLRAKTTGDALAPGESVSVPLSVKVPCDPTASGAVWTTEAKQSNGFNGPPGNGFALVKGTSDPALTTTGSCSFRFASPTSTQTAGSSIDVTVQAVDGAGHDTTSFNGPATLSGTFGSTYGAPSYGSLRFTIGSATSTATTYTAEKDRTLTATAGSITGTSNPFDVNPAAPNYLTFAQQPTRTAVSVAISPAVTVDVYDRYGNLETPSANQVSVTLSNANDAGGGSTVLGPAAGTTQSSSAGVATFVGITLDHSGLGFTLRASSTGLTSDTSNAFDVLDVICPQGVTTCTVTNSARNMQVTTDFGTKTLDDTGLLMSVPGAAFDCGTGGAQPAKGSLVTIVPPGGYDFSSPITTTLRFDKSIAPGTGVTNFVLCIKKDTAPTYSVVPNCPRKLKADSLPCITKRNRHGVGDLIIVMLMSSDDPVAGLH